MTTRRRSPERPPTVRRSASPRLDPYAVVGTITLSEYRRTRASAADVHVVRTLEDTSQPAA